VQPPLAEVSEVHNVGFTDVDAVLSTTTARSD
jgi:hypothetical protein